MLDKLSELKDGIYWANLYGRVYNKPTGFRTVEQCLEYLAKNEPVYKALRGEFKEKHPTLDVDVEIAFFRLKNSGLFKDGSKSIEEKREELGLFSVESIDSFRLMATARSLGTSVTRLI